MPHHYSFIDQLIDKFDYALSTVSGNNPTTERNNPAGNIEDENLSASDKKLSAALMRINHAGEISAQGLYQGQALTAKLDEVKQQMQQAAIEENDHLDWCQTRCTELNSHTSILSPLWYIGSYALGATAGKAGDKWSLGFVAETEYQVVKHLDEHLQKLPEQDIRSREILLQMREDELNHARIAEHAGAAKLPQPVKLAMSIVSKVMTKTAYYV
ncbi:MAG: 2-polyprenyl-3-methyl-6-methoxy-1,4-benzoquinone monooxygenase [Pseudomonadota bacterium]